MFGFLKLIFWCRQLAHLTSVLASGGPVLAEHLTSLGNPSDDPQVGVISCVLSMRKFVKVLNWEFDVVLPNFDIRFKFQLVAMCETLDSKIRRLSLKRGTEGSDPAEPSSTEISQVPPFVISFVYHGY